MSFPAMRAEEAWTIVRDPNRPDSDRLQAFDLMLSDSRGGPWGAGPLYGFAVAASVIEARALARRSGAPAGQLDPEDRAIDALMLLYEHAPTIEHIRPWIFATLRNLHRTDVRSRWQELVAAEVQDSMAPRIAQSSERLNPSRRQRMALGRSIAGTILTLKGKRGQVARLYFLENCSRDAICEILNISRDNLRAYIVRIRRDILASLSADAGTSTSLPRQTAADAPRRSRPSASPRE
jgi:DNA-directed RNA polymerase specialized sigma24 family protein